MKFRNPLQRSEPVAPEQRFNDWDNWFGGLTPWSANGVQYLSQSMSSSRETIPTDFATMSELVFRRSGPIFALIHARMRLFSEARFVFQSRTNGLLGQPFGTHDLAILESPWENGVTSDLLARMELDVSLAGNFYGVRRVGSDGRPRIARLRPDWVTIILGVNGEESDPTSSDAEVIGYLYTPLSGAATFAPATPSKNTEVFLPSEIVHYAPIPDPQAHYRGVSWITPMLREIASDSAATTTKLKFFENGATPLSVVKFDISVGEEAAKRVKSIIDEKQTGYQNAYKTLYLGAGADIQVIGSDFKSMDFSNLTSDGEVRMAAAAGVPAIIAGFSGGLDASTYSNVSQARKWVVDSLLRPLWRNAAASLATIVNVPAGAELTVDTRDVAICREDAGIQAILMKDQAQALMFLTSAGYDGDVAAAAIASGDLSQLVGSFTPPAVAPANPPLRFADAYDGEQRFVAGKHLTVHRGADGQISGMTELNPAKDPFVA